MVRLGDLIEVVLVVQDMQAQVAFYRDRLGLRVRAPKGATDFGQVRWVELETGACTLALHAGGRRRIGEDAPRLVFLVEDVHAARDELLRRDVPMGPVRPAAPGVWICDGTDPEGNRLTIEARA
jgi:catechol 2,3-dioxygenase-like lactoylglutathione lyase family enzyme